MNLRCDAGLPRTRQRRRRDITDKAEDDGQMSRGSQGSLTRHDIDTWEADRTKDLEHRRGERPERMIPVIEFSDSYEELMNAEIPDFAAARRRSVKELKESPRKVPKGSMEYMVGSNLGQSTMNTHTTNTPTPTHHGLMRLWNLTDVTNFAPGDTEIK